MGAALGNRAQGQLLHLPLPVSTSRGAISPELQKSKHVSALSYPTAKQL